MKKGLRITSIIMTLIISLGLFNLTATAAGEYKTWKQGDPRWGNIALGAFCNMADSGCKITSIAMLMVHAGVETETNFNPGVLAQKYFNGGYLTWNASNIEDDSNLLDSATNQENSPNFYRVGEASYHTSSFSQIYNSINGLLSQGYFVEVRVSYDKHSVAVDYCSNGEVYIMDPAGGGKTRLSQYNGGIERAFYYKKTASSQTALVSQADCNYPIRPLKIGEKFNIKGTISSFMNISQVNVRVIDNYSKVKTSKIDYPNSKTYNIETSANYDLEFNKLPEGKYRYIVSATVNSIITVLVNKEFIVTNPSRFASTTFKTHSMKDRLYSNEYLLKGDKLTSPDGKYNLKFQPDGNFVLYQGTKALWWTKVDSTSHMVIMQTDGNLVKYGSIAGNMLHPIWNAGTCVGEECYLAVQNDGNIVVYRKRDNKALWARFGL